VALAVLFGGDKLGRVQVPNETKRGKVWKKREIKAGGKKHVNESRGVKGGRSLLEKRGIQGEAQPRKGEGRASRDGNCRTKRYPALKIHQNRKIGKEADCRLRFLRGGGK